MYSVAIRIDKFPRCGPSCAHGAEQAGLLYYGPDICTMNPRVALYVERILKGAKPGELPVEQPQKFEIVINLKTARQLGLGVPRGMLLKADRVIE